ncbi:MAG: bifunctional enoyl-CoA hydratase/phosphate acetyltransferase [Bacilli bacterium]
MRQLNDLLIAAQKLPRQKIAVVSANDEPVIEAVEQALKIGFIHPILIGPKEQISQLIVQKNYQIDRYEIIDANSDEHASLMAMELVNNHQVDFIMKGLLDTKVLLKAVVNKETGIRKAPLLSHVGLISYRDYDRILFVTDGAMNIAPDVNDKVAIINNAVELAKTLGYQLPKVGLVAAVEKVNPKMLSTVDADSIVNLFKQGLIPDCLVDGPFAIDNLVSMEAVYHKGIKSDVAGMADILVFPGIDSGNVFYKTSVFLGKAESAGLILGAKCAIVLTSRADSAQSKLYSIALAAVYQYGLSHFSN